MQRLMIPFGAIAGIGLVFLLLDLAGALSQAVSVIAIAVCLGLVLMAGAIIVIDVGRLTRRLRRMDGTHPDVMDQPLLLTPVSDEINRLSRRLTRRAATAERHRLADTMILEHLPDPLIVLAEDRAVLRTNRVARDTFGADIPAVLRHPELVAAIEAARATGTQQVAQVSLAVPVARDVQATVMSMDPPLADGGRIVVVLSDRSRERAIDRMREDFVANVSHELRTPLTSLIGFTETLLGPAADDPPAQRQFLTIMAQQGARMHRLIDDLLSLSRIEMIEHQPPSDHVDLGALLDRLTPGYAPRLAERDATLAAEVAPDLPAVLGDTDQITQVLQNLIDNAVKYGRQGGTVRVAIRRPVETDPGWPNRNGVILAVSDDGIGIPREHLPRLTERFYRVDKGRSRAVGGTGLGLAIVKHIANRHRGQMRIDSEEGRGTTVSLWLPAVTEGGRVGD